MLVVRKEGKAHSQYNSFRSAFELLESVGRAPRDRYEEKPEDMPPLQRLERSMAEMHDCIQALKTENQNLKNAMSNLQLENQTLRVDVGELRSDYETLLKKQS